MRNRLPKRYSPHQAFPGISLMEISALILFVALLLAPLINNRAATLRSGTAIKMATSTLIYINNLVESASATGITPVYGYPDFNLDSLTAGQSYISPVVKYPTAGSDAFWYRWIVKDVSYRLTTNGLPDRNMSNQDVLVCPKGTRVFSATLQVYKKQPHPLDLNNPDDVFMTTLRSNAGIGLQETRVGVVFLFDNSDSMSERVYPGTYPAGLNYWGGDPPNDDLNLQDAAFAYHFPGDPDWTDYQLDPSIPNHKGDSVDASSRTNHYRTSLAGEVAGYYYAELGKGLSQESLMTGYNRIGFPHLTYRYPHLAGQGAQDFVNAYGLTTSQQLNPFNNDQLDLTLQRQYVGGNPNHTYPGPGMLGMPNSGSPGAPDANPGTWNYTETAKFFRIYDVIGATTAYTNSYCSGEGICGCISFANFLKLPNQSLATPSGFYFNASNGQYVGYNYNYTNPDSPPFNIFKNVPTHCMLKPTQAPYGPDQRRHITEISRKNPNDADFDDFVTKHLIRMEMARNSALKFLAGLEQYSEIVDHGKLGFTLFNRLFNNPIGIGSDSVPLKEASGKYLYLHPDKPKLFEDVRLILLRIERYGAPDGALTPFGQTPIYERLQEAQQALKSDFGLTDRFVVMFTDGTPTDSAGQADPSLPSAIRNLVRDQFNSSTQPITLFNLGIIGSDASQLKSWSDQSPGGATFYAGNQNQLDASFSQVIVLIQRRVLLNQINRYNLDLI